jgi:hypothetical protein
MKLFRSVAGSAILLGAFVFTSIVPAHADSFAWTTWTSVTPGNPGSATAAIAGGPTLTYTGQTNGLIDSLMYNWSPASSYIGGIVGNGPSNTQNSMMIEGGSNLLETITFSSPVVDPAIAIWSLGQTYIGASIDFTSSEPFSIVAGGPSSKYGGTSLNPCGPYDVCGNEANGVIVFDGTYSSISFTTPSYENYYTISVGEDTNLNAAPTPEPETLSLLGMGLAGLPFLRAKLASRRRRVVQA